MTGQSWTAVRSLSGSGFCVLICVTLNVIGFWVLQASVIFFLSGRVHVFQR